MKIFKQLFCALLVVGAVAARAKSCSQSYECGTQPFAHCYNMTAKHMLPGFGLDNGQHTINFINNLGAVDNRPDGASFFGRVSMDGGEFEVIEEIESDANVQNGQRVVQMYNYLESKHIPYVVNSKATAGNAGIGPYANHVFTQVWSVLSVYLGMAFDEKNNIMYSCDLDIRKYNKIPMTFEDRRDNTTMYTGQTCSGMSYYNGKLYFSANSAAGTSFYQADTTCVNCDKSKLSAIFNESSYIHGMTSSDTDIFYTSSTGIYQVSLANPSTKKQLSSDTKAGTIKYSEGFVYYQNDNQIISIEVATGKTKVLYDTATVARQNQCYCATGFSGDQCETCSGRIQWNNGIPKCYRENQPLFCVQDYECGNVPFTLCNYGTCSCRNNFYGAKCDQCDYHIIWENGIPVCEKNPTA
ncbi:hypothetical protein PPL_10972 [Heterostelium album PN500]|uniref:EGF-like domain-containing protein n=1 Tax=Heterostelium pallidum (strain ATCC 26659 / Pp 5 / PN500) TaxID=670386 RepID=D3BSK3_HETP5|nr:hypothetical protein PPL_10972 [Heterostelium album PN500]EFA75468.1 hypothetical protein PPL_10972 [Heterostelium album PN500]|eukprot:XP_020427602.1 hypothetical protein PPL_10972 [Heterostelium album PN500]